MTRGFTKEHICSPIDYCICSSHGTTPNSGCPIHGSPPWPPSCHICGRFISRSQPLEEAFRDRFEVGLPDACWPWLGSIITIGYGTLAHAKKTLLAHRVAYELTYGPIPKGKRVDHKCCNKICVNPAHLRLSSPEQNGWNMKMRKQNTSGFKGVSWSKKDHGWKAQMRCNGKNNYLGLYLTPEEAHAAYCAAAEKFHGEFANFGEDK